MPYLTICDCGGDLRIVEYTRCDTGDRVHDNVSLDADGFCPDSALETHHGFDTQDEITQCDSCGTKDHLKNRPRTA